MKTNSLNFLRFASALAGLVTTTALTGCGDSRPTPPEPPAAAATNAANPARPAPAPLALALARHSGDGKIDGQIRHFQNQVRSNIQAHASLERLGWLYVGKARQSFDPGYYTLAEQCALALDARQPDCVEALFLRGHTLQSQHRFHEAEPIARRLVARRGLAGDFGLLGDILLDVGRLDEAAAAYQSMLDLKPDPQGYARAAQIRWLKGDLEGALEIMRLAVAGVSSRDAESAAWMHTQFARFLWQAGRESDATNALHDALALRTNFAPALLLQGKMLLAAERTADAINWLQSAVRLNPLPEYQWTLAEALRTAGREAEATALEEVLVAKGPAADPRSCALFLATRRLQPAIAVRLARKELSERQDVFTHDALAWALAAASELEAAQPHLRAALAEGTRDARLWFHAGIIHAQAGQADESRRWLQQAEQARAQLLPGERALLREALASPANPAATTATTAAPPTPGLKPFPTAAVSGAALEN